MVSKIILAIKQSGTITYSELAKRAEGRGVSLDQLDEWLTKVMKDKNVRSTVKGDEIIYRWSPPKPQPIKSFFSHLTHLRANYPVMDETNDGHGIEADYSYLFISPAEMKQFKIDQKGGYKPKGYKWA